MRTRAVNPDTPTEAQCAAMYLADNLPTPMHAFVFRVLGSNTRFTVYALAPDRYIINATYRLTLAKPTEAPLHLDGDEADLLHNCLRLVEERWQEAITQADTEAARPETPRTAEPGFINVEPYPHGYRAIGAAFRHELGRVIRLRNRVDRFLTELRNPNGGPS